MKKSISLLFVLFVYMLLDPSPSFTGSFNPLPKKTIIYLKHNRKAAQKIFEEKCTKCHDAKTAMSRRSYQDWLLGVTVRHGKSKGWISDKDARQIFLHLVVHMEPEFKLISGKKSVIVEKNWLILLCTFSGILTILLFFLTYTFAHSKKLRKKWFKAHRNFAKATFAIAVFHGGLCFYLFVLK